VIILGSLRVSGILFSEGLFRVEVLKIEVTHFSYR